MIWLVHCENYKGNAASRDTIPCGNPDAAAFWAAAYTEAGWRKVWIGVSTIAN